jgi:hypothetical protein
MRFRVIPSQGQPFDHEQDAALTLGATFFHPPREPVTQGFFKVTAVEPGYDDEAVDAVVYADRVDS